MHELSLAKDIVEMVYQNVPANEIKNVQFVVMKVGQFSGVVTDSLKFSYSAITSQTDLEGSELEIIDIPFVLKCHNCNKNTANEFGMMICEECGSSNTEIISGDELKVQEVKLNLPEENFKE
jgi:hydrogenase nickel incorporation protein HypA/HybF